MMYRLFSSNRTRFSAFDVSRTRHAIFILTSHATCSEKWFAEPTFFSSHSLINSKPQSYSRGQIHEAGPLFISPVGTHFANTSSRIFGTDQFTAA